MHSTDREFNHCLVSPRTRGYCHSEVTEKGGAEAEQNSQGWPNPSALQPLVGHAGEFCMTDETQYTA